MQVGGPKIDRRIAGKYGNNCWEAFLVGEECCCCCDRTCPLCSCCTWFGVGWLFTVIFIAKIAADGDSVFSFDEQPVKSSNIVQAFYAFEGARGKRSGCDDEAHKDEALCKKDEECQWDAALKSCTDYDPCAIEETAKPREDPIRESDGGGFAWVTIIYETKADGNVLDDDVMEYMRKFEEELLTTANGASRNGKTSRWDEDWCLKVYADDTTSTCAGVESLLPLFSMTAAGMDAVEEQVKAGYGFPFGACLCSDQDELCSICAQDGKLAPQQNWPACFTSAVSPRRMAEDAGGYDTSAGDQARSRNLEEGNASCANINSGATPEQVLMFLEGLCATKPRCQWAPKGTSQICSSKAFYHPTDAKALVKGAEKNTFMDKMCDENNPAWWSARLKVLPQSFDCTTRKSRFAKSVFFAGAENPLDPDSYKKFETEYVGGKGDWFTQVSKFETDIESESDGKLRIIFYSSVTLFSQFMSVLIRDAVLSIGSMVFVWSYMWYTLESFFLASCAMFEIVFSLPVTFCLWNVVLQQKIIFTQMLVIFVILGIGADDAFILYDAWLQAPHEGEEVMKHWTTRFSFAYRRAFNAMMVTTATTFGSFVIGACSPLPMVRDFCVFAALVVLVDWLFCISFFASAVVVYERYFKRTNKPGECCGPGCCWGGCRALGSMLCGKRCVDVEDQDSGPKKRGMERFCEGPLFDFLNRARVFLVIFWCIIVVAMAINAGVSLRTAEKRSPVGREDLDVTRGIDILLAEFSFGGNPTVSFVYGIETEDAIVEWDDSGGDHVPRYANGVGMLTSKEGQLQLMELCSAADAGKEEDTRCDSRTCLVYGRGITGKCPPKMDVWRSFGVYIPEDIDCLTGRYCFIEEFAEYWASTQNGCKSINTEGACTAQTGCDWGVGVGGTSVCYSTAQREDYPGMEESAFIAELNSANYKAYRSVRDRTMRNFGRGFDVGNSQYLTGWKLASSTSMLMAWVSFNATIPRENSVEQANDWYDRWEAYRLKHSPGLGGFQTTNVYLFMVTQNEMVKAAVLGILLSLLISFIVLIITTLNYWVALLGLTNIAAISVVFLGMMPIIDWSLGENECIFLIAVVGLSVDYTVHLLHSYNHGPPGREARCKHALAEMGISVVNSSVTTLLAAIILFGCGFYFFFQFGAFIFFVIGFSILMSIFLLIPLLLLLGPHEGQGDLRKYLWKTVTTVSPADQKSAGDAIANNTCAS